ncbi:MAG: T9SS type A sorting domain-containing protein, partial [Bacteroidota bacterium]
SIPSSSRTSVIIYDVLGREVTTLVDSFKIAGNYSIDWMANNVPSGVYFCTMASGNFLETKKIVLIK